MVGKTERYSAQPVFCPRQTSGAGNPAKLIQELLDVKPGEERCLGIAATIDADPRFGGAALQAGPAASVSLLHG